MLVFCEILMPTENNMAWLWMPGQRQDVNSCFFPFFLTHYCHSHVNYLPSPINFTFVVQFLVKSSSPPLLVQATVLLTWTMQQPLNLPLLIYSTLAWVCICRLPHTHTHPNPTSSLHSVARMFFVIVVIIPSTAITDLIGLPFFKSQLKCSCTLALSL